MGPHWIKQWIANLAVLNEQFRDDDGRVDFEALGREEYQFRMALITQNLSKSPRAKETYLQTKKSYDAWVENGRKGGRPRKEQETSSDVDTREGSMNIHDGSNAGQMESGTSDNHSEAPQSQARESRRTGTAVPELRRAANSPAPVRSSGPMPANVQEVYDFASREGLDKDDAYECWYVTTAERDGNDADGNPVTNWKAFVRTWCNTRSKKRSA